MVRWRIAILVSAAIAISYLDRQTLPVAIKAIGQDIPITNEQFSLLQSSFLIAYAVMYAAGGKLMDVLGTRAGMLLIMVFWSLACASHGLATGIHVCRTLKDMRTAGLLVFTKGRLRVLDWDRLIEIAGMTNPPKQFYAGSDALAVVTPTLEARLREIKDHEELSKSTDGSF